MSFRYFSVLFISLFLYKITECWLKTLFTYKVSNFVWQFLEVKQCRIAYPNFETSIFSTVVLNRCSNNALIKSRVRYLANILLSYCKFYNGSLYANKSLIQFSVVLTIRRSNLVKTIHFHLNSILWFPKETFHTALAIWLVSELMVIWHLDVAACLFHWTLNEPFITLVTSIGPMVKMYSDLLAFSSHLWSIIVAHTYDINNSSPRVWLPTSMSSLKLYSLIIG